MSWVARFRIKFLGTNATNKKFIANFCNQKDTFLISTTLPIFPPSDPILFHLNEFIGANFAPFGLRFETEKQIGFPAVYS